MPGGLRAQPSRSRLGPADDDSGDDLARSSIDPEDVTAYQEVVYRPPRENEIGVRLGRGPHGAGGGGLGSRSVRRVPAARADPGGARGEGSEVRAEELP